MQSLFITLVLAVAISATLGYSVFSLQRSSEIATLTQRNSSRMEGMASLMRASLRYDSAHGTFMPPLGAPFQITVKNSDGTTKILARQGLPAYIVGDDHTPWGGRYAYCPYSSVGQVSSSDVATDIPSEVTTGSDGNKTNQTYTVGARALYNDRGQSVSYVSGMAWGGAPPVTSPDIVGFIVAPIVKKGNGADIPNCSDIDLSGGDGFYVINGKTGPMGTVVAISGAGITKTQTLTQANNPVIYVAPGNGSTGKNDGTSPANAMPMSAALKYWHDTFPVGTSFVLTAGDYSLSAAEADFSLPDGVAADEVSGSRAYVEFVGPSSGTATLRGSGSLMLGINAQFSGAVTIDASLPITVLPGTRVSIKSVGTIGSVSVFSGDLSFTSGQATTVGSLAMSSGSLSLVSTKVTLSNPPVFDASGAAPRIALLQTPGMARGSLTVGGTPFQMTTSVSGTSSDCSQTTDGSNDAMCSIACPSDHPYPTDGECQVPDGSATATLAGFGTFTYQADASAQPQLRRYCRWHPAALQTAATGTAPAVMVAGNVVAKCSAFPR